MVNWLPVKAASSRFSTPPPGEVLTRIAEASTEQVEAAILAAHRAFAGWSRTTPQQRSNLLLEIANTIEKTPTCWPASNP